jgi:hypothetical protein
MLHLERVFFALRAESADISAACNRNISDRLLINLQLRTYSNVHGSVPAGTLLQIADMFLQEHF